MKLQSIGDKSLQEIEQCRTSIINYARYFFERKQPSCIYAFSQFRNEQDLFLLILAKKKGVFDYGELITRDGVDAWKHPSPIEVMQDLSSSIAQMNLGTPSTRTEVKQFLTALSDIDVTVTKDFQDLDAWKSLSEKEKVERKTEMLTEFYKKNGKRELQRKHYEIMRVRTERGESAEIIISRIANSAWEPLEAKKVREVEVSDSWKRASSASESLKDTGQVIVLTKLVHELTDSLDELREELDNVKVRTSEAELRILDRVLALEIAEPTRLGIGLKTVKKDEKKAFKESDLCVLSLRELKTIAKDLGIKGADSALIPTFLIRKILAK
jgi:hypothetical protein